jgi:hypothetical protein
MAFAQSNCRFRSTRAPSASMAERFLAYVKRFCPYSTRGPKAGYKPAFSDSANRFDMMDNLERLLGRAVFQLWPNLPRDMQERIFEAASSARTSGAAWLSCATINIPRRLSRRHPARLPSPALVI